MDNQKYFFKNENTKILIKPNHEKLNPIVTKSKLILQQTQIEEREKIQNSELKKSELPSNISLINEYFEDLSKLDPNNFLKNFTPDELTVDAVNQLIDKEKKIVFYIFIFF